MKLGAPPGALAGITPYPTMSISPGFSGFFCDPLRPLVPPRTTQSEKSGGKSGGNFSSEAAVEGGVSVERRGHSLPFEYPCPTTNGGALIASAVVGRALSETPTDGPHEPLKIDAIDFKVLADI